MGRRLELAVFCVLAALYVYWLAWPLAWTASAERDLVAVFNVDESAHALVIGRLFRAGSMHVTWESYGHLHFNLSLLALYAISLFRRVDFPTIIVTLRAVPMVCAAGTLVGVFVLGRLAFGRAAGWLAAAFQATMSPSFLALSFISHPDVPQLCFFVLAMYFCCRLVGEESWRWLVLASAMAGLAFASKYSGAFVMPIILAVAAAQSLAGRAGGREGPEPGLAARGFGRVLAVLGFLAPLGGVVVGLLEGHRSKNVGLGIGLGLLLFGLRKAVHLCAARSPRLTDVVCKAAASLGLFAATFAAVSPYSLEKWRVIRGIEFESKHVATGHFFRESGGVAKWAGAVASDMGLSTILFALAAVSLAWVLREVFRKGWRRLLSPDAVLWSCVLLYVGYVVLQTRMVRVRYLMPAMPLLVVLSMQPVGLLIERARRGLLGWRVTAVASVALAGVIGVALASAVSAMLSFRAETLVREQTSNRVQAGYWVKAHYPPSSRMLYDRFCYTPMGFRSTRFTWGGRLRDLEEYDPDIILVYDRVSGMYADVARAPLFRQGEGEFMARRAYYEALRDGRTAYELVRDFGEVQVYERRKGAS